MHKLREEQAERPNLVIQNIKVQPHFIIRLNQRDKAVNISSIEWLTAKDLSILSDLNTSLSLSLLILPSSNSKFLSSLVSAQIHSSTSRFSLRRKEVSFPHSDLVPLVEMSQLFTRKVNYLHLR